MQAGASAELSCSTSPGTAQALSAVQGWLSPSVPPRAGDLSPLCSMADGSAGCQRIPIPCSSEPSLIVFGSIRKETCCFLPRASPLGCGPAGERRYQRLRSRANKPSWQQRPPALVFSHPAKPQHLQNNLEETISRAGLEQACMPHHFSGVSEARVLYDSNIGLLSHSL